MVHYKPSILGYPYFLETPIKLSFNIFRGASDLGGSRPKKMWNARIFVEGTRRKSVGYQGKASFLGDNMMFLLGHAGMKKTII